MSDIAIEVNHVWKRFRKGEIHDSLRDLIPSVIRGLFVRNHKRSELSENDFWALKDICFQVRRGEVLGIIGSNGSGKSTILKLLSKIIKANKGNIKVNGRLSALIEVGAGFHPDLTGRENVFLNGAILGMKKGEINKIFDEIVDFSSLEEFIDTPVKRYSSGMYARLGFAVAAFVDPEILLVDEVLAVGDIGFQKKCIKKMHDVAGCGRTVVFVSHNMGAIKSLCDRCLLLTGGIIQIQGPPNNIVAEYTAYYHEMERTPHPKIINADPGRGEGFILCHKNNGGEMIVSCGDPITFEFNIETPKLLSEVSVGITIITPGGDPIVSMSSKVQNVPSATGSSRVWRACCDLGRIPINAGTYFVRVYVGNGRIDVARFSNAFTIRVLDHDVFGWGNRLPSTADWGPIYWAPKWDIRPV